MSALKKHIKDFAVVFHSDRRRKLQTNGSQSNVAIIPRLYSVKSSITSLKRLRSIERDTRERNG